MSDLTSGFSTSAEPLSLTGMMAKVCGANSGEPAALKLSLDDTKWDDVPRI